MNVKRELTEIRTSRDSTTDFMSAKQKHLIGVEKQTEFPRPKIGQPPACATAHGRARNSSDL